MKKIIIDTDTGSDDAVALVMALRDPSVEVLAVTTVSGNVEVNQAAYNALQSIDFAGTYQPPVFKGMGKPLICDLEVASQVHGKDGMSDIGFRAPTQKPEAEHAVDALLRLIGNGSGNIELVTIGPLTNIAMAMMQSPDVMKKVPHITLMGGAHFYTNAHTVSAEYNIMADPEAADVVFRFGVPITMVTLEACQDGTAPLNADDIAKFRASGEIGAFCMNCNQVTIDMAEKAYGYEELELPDPVAYAVFSKPELIQTSFDAQTIIELGGTYTRGTTVFKIRRGFFDTEPYVPNSKIVTGVDGTAFKDFMYRMISDQGKK